MLNINYPKIEKKEFPNLELNLVEPIHKLNLRGKIEIFLQKLGEFYLLCCLQSQIQVQLLKILVHCG